MGTWQPEEGQGGQFRYQPGDRVRIIGGLDRGHRGEIVAVYPSHPRAYLVKLNDAWYVHYPEHRLAPAAGSAPAETDRGPDWGWTAQPSP
jgi:hypothetical protein